MRKHFKYTVSTRRVFKKVFLMAFWREYFEGASQRTSENLVFDDGERNRMLWMWKVDCIIPDLV